MIWMHTNQSNATGYAIALYFAAYESNCLSIHVADPNRLREVLA